VQGGVDDGRPEIFEHDPPRGRRRRNSKAARCRRSHVATSGRRRARRTDGGCTRGPSRRPRRGAPGPARGRGRAGVAEVHLRLLARGDLQPDARAGRRRGLAPQEAFHRGVAAAEAVLLDQQLPDRLALEPRACRSSICSQNGSTNDCSWAGRSWGAGCRAPPARRATAAGLRAGRDARPRAGSARPMLRLTPRSRAMRRSGSPNCTLPHDLPDIGHRAPPPLRDTRESADESAPDICLTSLSA